MAMWTRASVRAGVCALWLSVVMTGSAAASIIDVPAGGDLQAALDAAPAGSTILLEPGATYTGPFTIRRAVTIQTSGTFPDVRVTPGWSGTLAILASPTNEPALRLAPGVRGVRLIALEVAPNGFSNGTSIEIGSLHETDSTRQPVDVILDRLLVRGHPVHGQKRGLSLHGRDITVQRSYISDIKRKGQDTQAIWINNGWGPYVIDDNYVEASGENILTGGDTPRIDQLVPSDITVTRNTIVKPLEWKAEGWTVKNLLELKSARRVIIRGNVFRGSWVSGQVGYGILLTPKDQYGLAPWTTVQDVLVESNVVHEIGEAIRVLGDDNLYPAVRAARIVIRNNLLIVDQAAHGGSGRCLTVGRSPQQLEFSGNTCIANGSTAFYTYRAGDVLTVTGGVFRRNVFLHNEYGFSGDQASAGGVVALAPHYPDLVFVDNLIGGGGASRYPGNFVVEVADFKAQFEDYAAGDFRLTTAGRARFSTRDGGLLGADLSAPVTRDPLPPVTPAPPADGPPTGGGAPRTVIGRGGIPPEDVPLPGDPLPAPGHGRIVRRDGTSAAPVATPPRSAGAPRAHAQASRARTERQVAGALVSSTAPVSVPAPPVAGIAVAATHAVVAGASFPPTVSLTVSAPADALPAHVRVTLSADARHLTAPLGRIDILVDGTIVGSGTRAPFEVLWQAPASGAFRITATVVDVHGGVSRSEPLAVQIR